MNDAVFANNWALGLAAVIGGLAAITVFVAIFRRSVRGQLKRVCAEHKKAQKIHRQAAAVTETYHRRLGKLGKNAENVKPRLLQEAKDALQDARALEKIASDQVLIAGNHVHRVIHEEFPPSRQQALRDRYLPSVEQDKGPFSF